MSQLKLSIKVFLIFFFFNFLLNGDIEKPHKDSLWELKVDVKIDGSFIKQLDKSFEDKVFVRALTEVSQALGKKTVAEFVENEEVLEVLKGFGVDYAQGYHIGKPGFIE